VTAIDSSEGNAKRPSYGSDGGMWFNLGSLGRGEHSRRENYRGRIVRHKNGNQRADAVDQREQLHRGTGR
jgi:hypothetical protein